MTNVTSPFYREKMTLTYLLSAIFLIILMDLSFDILEGAPFREIAFDLCIETSLMGLVLVTSLYVWRKFTAEKVSKLHIERDLQQAQANAIKWEKKSRHFVEEFQNFMLAQFNQWNLSQSEKEIALLILKGKTSKEIASIRFTSERTIRNQCQAIYEKSQLSGKNEFSAYFLSELMDGASSISGKM